MKYLALNVVFNGVRFDPLGSRAVLGTSTSNLGTPLKTCDFCYCRLI